MGIRPQWQADLNAAIDRERASRQRRVEALCEVKETFAEYGYGHYYRDSIRDAIAAEDAWRAAQDALNRLWGRLRAEAAADAAAVVHPDG